MKLFKFKIVFVGNKTISMIRNESGTFIALFSLL